MITSTARYTIDDQRKHGPTTVVALTCEIVWDPEKRLWKASTEDLPQFDVWGDNHSTVALDHFKKRLGFE